MDRNPGAVILKLLFKLILAPKEQELLISIVSPVCTRTNSGNLLPSVAFYIKDVLHDVMFQLLFNFQYLFYGL